MYNLYEIKVDLLKIGNTSEKADELIEEYIKWDKLDKLRTYAQKQRKQLEKEGRSKCTIK